MPCYGTLMVGQVPAGPLDRQTPVHHLLRPPLEASADRPHPGGGAHVGQAPSHRTGPPPLHSPPLADPERPASHATGPAPPRGSGTTRHPAPGPQAGRRATPPAAPRARSPAEPFRALLPLQWCCLTDAQEVALGNEFVERLRFDFAAPRLACRDQWIGWQNHKYHKQLHLVVRKTRWLRWPWVPVPTRARHALERVVRQLPPIGQREPGTRAGDVVIHPSGSYSFALLHAVFHPSCCGSDRSETVVPLAPPRQELDAPYGTLTALARLAANPSEAVFRQAPDGHGRPAVWTRSRPILHRVGHPLQGRFLLQAQPLRKGLPYLVDGIAKNRPWYRPQRSYPRRSRPPETKRRNRQAITLAF